MKSTEQYSRKSSVRIYGIREEEGEKMAEKVINIIKEEIGVETEAEEIDITHRAGQKHKDRGRGILVIFVSHKSKVKIMKKKRQAKNIRASKDLAQGTRKILNDIHAKKTQLAWKRLRLWTVKLSTSLLTPNVFSRSEAQTIWKSFEPSNGRIGHLPKWPRAIYRNRQFCRKDKCF